MYWQLCLLLFVSHVVSYCPPAGRVLPPPQIPAKFSIPGLVDALDQLARNASSINISATSFSVSITSRDSTFFEYHHTAQLRNESGVREIDRNTVYRAGSHAKILVTLATMREAPSLDDPIAKFIPELNGVKGYENVTLRLLASHMAGIPREANSADRFTVLGPKLEQVGFPVPADSGIPSCDAGPGSHPCSRAEYFQTLLNKELTILPGDRAAYSNSAFILIGLALESITGKPFEQTIKDTITGPLGLTATGFDMPDPSGAIIPQGAGWQWYSQDVSNYKATGGLYTTPAELCIFLRSILNSDFLPPAKTRAWLKPKNFLSHPYGAVGMPWEIYRTADKLIRNGGRPVELYTKTSDVGTYSAWSAIIPEFDVAIAINTAGDEAHRAAARLIDLVSARLIPAVDDLAREQAAAAFAGRYGGGYGGGGASDALTLVVDDGPGLGIGKWTIGGKSVFDGFAITMGSDGVRGRIYPIGDGSRWRMVLEEKSSGEPEGLPSLNCQTWFKTDNYRYGKLPLDEFDFQVGQDGVQGVTIPGLRQTLVKEAMA